MPRHGIIEGKNMMKDFNEYVRDCFSEAGDIVGIDMFPQTNELKCYTLSFITLHISHF